MADEEVEDWEPEIEANRLRLEELSRRRKIKRRVRNLYISVVTRSLMRKVEDHKLARLFTGPVLATLQEEEEETTEET